uniref:ATP synthase subunit 8 n=1 Tax=Imerinia grandidieri TaxID=3244470 RepID=G8HQX8_9EUPU|nr:ATP synthase subunit 8 [Rhopalocaulis grandidieri]
MPQASPSSVFLCLVFFLVWGVVVVDLLSASCAPSFSKSKSFGKAGSIFFL